MSVAGSRGSPAACCLRPNLEGGCLFETAGKSIEGTQRRRRGLPVEAGQTRGPLPTPIQPVKSAELGYLCRKSREKSHPSQSSAVEVNRKGSCVCVLSCFSRVRLCETPWTVHQAPLSMGFSRQEYWSELPCPPPGHLPDPGIQPTSLISPVSAGEFFTPSATWEAQRSHAMSYLF